jgi:hypothetical protein
MEALPDRATAAETPTAAAYSGLIKAAQLPVQDT